MQNGGQDRRLAEMEGSKKVLFSVFFNIEILFSILFSIEIHHRLTGYSGVIQKISFKLTNTTTKLFKKPYKLITSHARACTVFLISILAVAATIINTTPTPTPTPTSTLRLLRLLPTHEFLYSSIHKIGGVILV